MSYKLDYFFKKEFRFWQTVKFVLEIRYVFQQRTHNVIESWSAKCGSPLFLLPLAWLQDGLNFGCGWSFGRLSERGEHFTSFSSPTSGLGRHRLLLPSVISECRWSLLIISHNNKSVPANPTRISEHYFQRGNKKNIKDRKAGLAAQRDKDGQSRQVTWELSMVSSRLDFEPGRGVSSLHIYD